jgi:hypothetical protein
LPRFSFSFSFSVFFAIKMSTYRNGRKDILVLSFLHCLRLFRRKKIDLFDFCSEISPLKWKQVLFTVICKREKQATIKCKLSNHLKFEYFRYSQPLLHITSKHALFLCHLLVSFLSFSFYLSSYVHVPVCKNYNRMIRRKNRGSALKCVTDSLNRVIVPSAYSL